MSGVPKDRKFYEESNEAIRNVLRPLRAEIFGKEVGSPIGRKPHIVKVNPGIDRVKVRVREKNNIRMEIQ